MRVCADAHPGSVTSPGQLLPIHIFVTLGPRGSVVGRRGISRLTCSTRGHSSRMDVLAKALLVIGAVALLAVTLAGLILAVKYMYASLAPFGRWTRIGACVGVGLFALAPPAAAFAGLSAGEAMVLMTAPLAVTLGVLIAKGPSIRRRRRSVESE